MAYEGALCPVHLARDKRCHSTDQVYSELDFGGPASRPFNLPYCPRPWPCLARCGHRPQFRGVHETTLRLLGRWGRTAGLTVVARLSKHSQFTVGFLEAGMPATGNTDVKCSGLAGCALGGSLDRGFCITHRQNSHVALLRFMSPKRKLLLVLCTIAVRMTRKGPFPSASAAISATQENHLACRSKPGSSCGFTPTSLPLPT